MTTRFILDNQLKEQMSILEEIDYLTKKKPYPDNKSVHLARFLDSCFQIVEQEKIKEEQAKTDKIRIKQRQEFEHKRKAEEITKKQTLEIEAPSPIKDIPPMLQETPGTLMDLPPLLNDIPTPMPELEEKREYVIQIYNNQVGILVEKNTEDKYYYQAIEPSIEPKIIEKAKELFGKEIEKNPSILDNKNYMQKITEKTTQKVNIPFTSLMPGNLHYYLERDYVGGNKFDPLLYDEKIKTIYCEGAMKPIKVEYEPFGTIETNIILKNNEDFNQFLKRLLIATGKVFNESNPIIDLTIQGLKFEGIIGLGETNTKLTIRRVKNAS
ncbi:hypothetical protein J4467_02810 [Candidatus Woesearchaeota archaeon]|nr:hypothetical protein [Candidatus Woesearchaeota archaeon]